MIFLFTHEPLHELNGLHVHLYDLIWTRPTQGTGTIYPLIEDGYP